MVYEGMGTTWATEDRVLAKSAFGRHAAGKALKGRRDGLHTYFTLWICETHLQLHPLLCVEVAMDRALH